MARKFFTRVWSERAYEILRPDCFFVLRPHSFVCLGMDVLVSFVDEASLGIIVL